MTCLKEELNIHDVLEFDKLEWDNVSSELLLCEDEVLDGGHTVSLVEVESVGLVGENPHRLGSLVGRGLHLDAVALDGLVEGEREDDLLVTVGPEVSAPGGEAVLVGVLVILVETLGLALVYEGDQVHHPLHSTLLPLGALLAIVVDDLLLQGLVIGALQLVYLCLVSKEEKCGHGSHSLSSSGLLALVNVNLKHNKSVNLTFNISRVCRMAIKSSCSQTNNYLAI